MIFRVLSCVKYTVFSLKQLLIIQVQIKYSRFDLKMISILATYFDREKTIL
jgi:hypothetical protein